MFERIFKVVLWISFVLCITVFVLVMLQGVTLYVSEGTNYPLQCFTADESELPDDVELFSSTYDRPYLYLTYQDPETKKLYVVDTEWADC